MTKPVSAAILARVSSDRQSPERQIADLTAYAESQGWELVETIVACVSGSKVRYSDREDVQQVSLLAESGRIQKLLVHEVSRIGRSPLETLQLVELCHEHGVSVADFSQKCETLTSKGRPTLYANVILPLLAGLARNETEERRDRIMSGLATARRKGKKLGRPKGTTTPREEFLANHKDVIKQLKAGQSIRNAAKITGKGTSTVQRVKSAMDGGGGQRNVEANSTRLAKSPERCL